MAILNVQDFSFTCLLSYLKPKGISCCCYGNSSCQERVCANIIIRMIVCTTMEVKTLIYTLGLFGVAYEHVLLSWQWLWWVSHV